VTLHHCTPLYLGLARTLYIRCTHGIVWQGNHQIYGHMRCINTVLANPTCITSPVQKSNHIFFQIIVPPCITSPVRKSDTWSLYPFVSRSLFKNVITSPFKSLYPLVSHPLFEKVITSPVQTCDTSSLYPLVSQSLFKNVITSPFKPLYPLVSHPLFKKVTPFPFKSSYPLISHPLFKNVITFPVQIIVPPCITSPDQKCDYIPCSKCWSHPLFKHVALRHSLPLLSHACGPHFTNLLTMVVACGGRKRRW